MNAPLKGDDELLVREQFVVLTRLVPILYAEIAFADCGLILGYPSIRSSWPLLLGGAALLVVCVLRMLYWIGLRRDPLAIPTDHMRRIMRTMTGLACVIAMAFGIVTVFLMRTDGALAGGLAVIGVWASAVACAFCLFSMRPASFGTVIAGAIPLVVEFGLSGDTVLMAMAAIVFTLSALVIFVLNEFYKSFEEMANSRAKLDRARRAATDMAFTDSLTGLPNRRFIDDALRNRQAGDGPLAIVMIDLDGFKPINDMFGHAVGDVFLIEAGQRLENAAAGRGQVARMGGDEFAILCKGVSDSDTAMAIAGQLIAAMRAPFTTQTISAEMRASAGVAVAAAGEDAARLLERADNALYAAKANGRGVAILFTADLEDAARERATIEQGLRKAIVEQSLDVHFQPIIDLAAGRITGFEALARWSHPELGPISPAVFIPIAEQIGLIEPLTNCLLLKAAKIAVGWPSNVRLAFNLSAAQLVKPGAALRIMSLLAEAGLPPHRFEAEATETAIMKDVDAARATLDALKQAGAHISLDDFGTGYSSFSQLRDLPLDKVKIDKSFVDRILMDEKVAKVVRAMIGMCGHLNLSCVAEGIERVEQMQMLQEIGCGAGQGYLISRPVPPSEIAALIAMPLARSA